MMNPGCQNSLWHKLLPNQSPLPAGTWFSMSFRKLSLQYLPNGFGVHPERAAIVRDTLSTPVNPVATGLPASENRTYNINTGHPARPAKDLVLGDSLVRGLRLPSNSIRICRGGMKPGELLHLLHNSTDILHPEMYDTIKTVTLIVGTNAKQRHAPIMGIHNKSSLVLDKYINHCRPYLL